MDVGLKLRFRIVAALVGVVFLVATSYVFLQYGLGYYKGGYKLTARFNKSVQGLDTTSDVKIRGVKVGQVTGIHLRDGGAVDVTMKMVPGSKVPATSVASIEPLSVFGPGYVALEPGAAETTGPYLHGGDQIAHTKTSTAFTTLLSHTGKVLEQINVNDLSTVMHTFAQGVSGLGPQLGSLTDNSAALIDLGVRHAPQIQQFLTDLSGLSQTLVEHTDDLRTTTGALNQALPAFDAQRDQLTLMLDRASAVSGQLGQYLDQHKVGIGQFFDDGSAVLRVAYEQAPQFPNLIDTLNQFFDKLGRAIRLPGPHNTLIGAVRGDFFTGFCVNAHQAVPVICRGVGPGE